MKNRFLFPAIIFCFVLAEKICQAQRQNHQWRYGSTGISFNTNPPSQVQGASLQASEGSASVADRNTGELLFYTDGVTVWNRQNTVMQNGTMLRGGSAALLSSTTAAVIVPKPGSENLYYIITVDEGASGTGSGGVRYNLVNMTLDGGLGAVVASQKNIFLYATTTEKLEVVPAANGTDLWIITHDYSNFVSFRLGPEGIQPTPVQSVVSGDLANTAGHLKVNRQFNMLACGSTFEGRIRLFNFNNATGVVTDRISFGLNPFLNTSPLIYGLEFAPGGRFLYASNLSSTVQYDVSLSTQEAIENSAFFLNSGGASIQLGPDQKIYINNGSLNVINCPDKPGSLCGFEPGSLAGGGYGLPKWVYYAGDSASAIAGNAILSRDSCLGANTQFTLRNNAGFSAVSWNFGDPASGASNTGSGTETNHVFSAAGNFNVRAILMTTCGFDTIFLNNFEIRSCNAPCTGALSFTGDSCLQTDFSFSISGPEIISVNWNFGDPGSGIANGSNLPAPIHRFSSEGEFLVRAVVNFSCGTDTLEIPVMVKDCSLPVCSATIKAQVLDSCLGEVAFSITSGDAVILQSWDFGDSASGNLNSSSRNNPVHRFSSDGIFRVRLVTLLSCGLDTAEKEVSIQRCQNPLEVCEIQIPNAITPNADEVNDVFIPQSNCAFPEYELRIFNRWGKEVFSSRNPEESWPDKNPAENQAITGDVYFFSLSWRFEGEQLQKRNGTVSVLRQSK